MPELKINREFGEPEANELILLRREIHQFPDLSGEEGPTATRIQRFFEALAPDQTLMGLGGEGIAFVFEGARKGPSTLIRCELDGLPIVEQNPVAYKSKIPGKSHTCGHDGHMAIICGLGKTLSAARPSRGKVVLLFQPAEETGEGALKVLQSPTFSQIKPDFAFALHNLPGNARHEIILKKGTFTAASKGIEISLYGKTSHAAHPEDGKSPAEAMAQILVGLKDLPKSMEEYGQVTVVNAVLGEQTFGTSPGKAVIRATLRTFEDIVLDRLGKLAESYVHRIAEEQGLSVSIKYREAFNTTQNHAEAWAIAEAAAKALGLKTRHLETPILWSEDFGRFSKVSKTLMFGLGAGPDQPQLHEPGFDFPDEIIATGVKMFSRIVNLIHH